MAKESIQSRQERTRRPPVHIKFEVDNDGAIEEKEIPLVVGVMSDLAGHRKEPPPPLAERQFKEVDRDNFDRYLGSVAPRLSINVENALQPDQAEQTALKVELNFSTMDDFEPENIVKQVEPLRELLRLRQQLAALKFKLGGNDRLEGLLQEILHNAQKRDQLAGEVGLSPAAAPPSAAPAPAEPESEEPQE
jgi:type VI secretion system protein ImpB